METSSPARLHVLIAREAATALVIRRGPAKQVCTFSWDRRNDLVTLAQWMAGRIYGHRCDLCVSRCLDGMLHFRQLSAIK